MFFRGSSKLPKNATNKRLICYSLYSFGVPAIMTTLVFCLDRFVNDSKFRPGFGEETCWFNSCTHGIYLLYG